MQLRLQTSRPRPNSGAQVHTWNGGGIGIKITAPQTRLLGCYLDYNSLQVVDPSQLTVTETFFLETYANFTSAESKALRGVYFEGNVYAGSGDSIRIDPAFTDGTDTIVANEINGGCILRLTARRALVSRRILPNFLVFAGACPLMFSGSNVGARKAREFAVNAAHRASIFCRRPPARPSRTRSWPAASSPSTSAACCCCRSVQPEQQYRRVLEYLSRYGTR